MNANTKFEQSFGKSHAFLIGINEYKHLNPLHNAVNDVRAIEQLLTEENVHDFIVHPPLENATYEEMLNLLQVKMPELLTEEDRVLFYFAGHGLADPSESGRPEGYILPSDAMNRTQDGNHWLAMSKLNQALEALPCKHFLLVLDCCFSGAFRWASNKRSNISLPKKIYKQHFDRFVKEPAWQVLTSSSYDQEAFDGLNDLGTARNQSNQKNSPFALLFMDALRGEADFKPNDQPDGDGLITVNEMYMYIRDKLEVKTQEFSEQDRQTPGLFSLKKHDKGEFIFLSPKKECNLPSYDEKSNPYKGLKIYEAADAARFYGRDGVKTALLEKIKSQKLTIVLGGSATGKSSLLRAGVLPEMHDYEILFMCPQQQPMEALNILLPKLAAAEQPILFIDQFEEILTLCNSEEERTHFLNKLQALYDTDTPLKIVLSVRSDFEAILQEKIFQKDWQAARFDNLGNLSAKEVREIIEGPALQRLILFEPPELIDRIAEEVHSAAGALPLLSSFMSELHDKIRERGEFGAFKQEDYDALGSVIEALYKRADKVYHELPVEEQNTMQKILLRMVSQEQDGADIKVRPILKKELVYLEEEENTRIVKVLDKLIDARLVVASTSSMQETVIVPIHDALILSWDTLLGWVNVRGKDKLALLHQLYEANTEYQRTASTRDLWHGNQRLDRIKIETQWLNASEQSFVQASVQRKNRNRIILAATTVFTMAALVVLALVAVKQRNEARMLSQESTVLNETLLFEDGVNPSVSFDDVNFGIRTFRRDKYVDRLKETVFDYVSMSDGYRYLFKTGQTRFEKGEYREALTYFANARFVKNVYDTDEIETAIKTTENLRFHLPDDSESKDFDGFDFLKSKQEESSELDTLIERCRMGIEANRLYFAGVLQKAKEKYNKLEVIQRNDSASIVFLKKQISHIDAITNELELTFTEEESSLRLGINQLDILPKEVHDVKTLVLSDNKLETVPQNIHLFKNLEEIVLNRNNLNNLPEAFSELDQLKILGLKENPGLMSNFDLLIKHLPPNINELDLSRNGVVKQLPNSLQKLSKLKLLKLSVKKESQESRGQRRMDFFQIIEQGAAASPEAAREETSVFEEVNTSDDLMDLIALDNFEQDLEIIIADENDFNAKGLSVQSGDSSLSVEKKENRLIVILFKETTSATLPESLQNLKNLKSIDVSRSIHQKEYKEWLPRWLPNCELIFGDKPSYRINPTVVNYEESY